MGYPYPTVADLQLSERNLIVTRRTTIRRQRDGADQYSLFVRVGFTILVAGENELDFERQPVVLVLNRDYWSR